MKLGYIRSFILFTFLVCSWFANGQQLTNKSISVDGVDREYLVYLPRGFDENQSLPVLFCFHAGGGYSESMMKFTADFRPLADENQFIAVYPQGLVASAKGDVATNWNYKGPYDNGTDELGFAESMIEALAADHSVNTSRIFACGFSQGGNLMWDFASLLGDRFAAVACVAASMWQWTYDDFSPNDKIGVLSIHGTNDTYNPYNGNQYSLSMDSLNDYWVDINNSEGTFSSTQYARGVTRYVWGPAEDCHSVEHFRVQGGIHDWPSFSEQAIWEFFSRYDIDGLIQCGSTVNLTIESYDLSNKELTIDIDSLPSGSYELRKSIGGKFRSFDPELNINSDTQFPLIIRGVEESSLIIQLWDKS